jgi:hypothetical protein
MRYFTDAGPYRGPLLSGTVPGTICVLEALDKPTPIGVAQCVGWDARGRAVWTLSVHDADVPGLWIVVDREFRPAH